jgi:hypothetical protein
MKQTDALARTIGDGASKLKDLPGTENHEAVMELFAVTKDLHNSWTARVEQGETPSISRRFLK